MASPYRIYAMRELRVGVACVCTHARYVVFDNGVQVPIQGFLDDDKKPTNQPEKYSYYTFGTDEFGYGIGSFDAYDMVSWEEH